MEFCPHCGSLLIPHEGNLECRCGYVRVLQEEDKEKYNIEEHIGKKREIPVIEEDIATMPRVKVECRKCKNGEAYYWMLQTRAGDEPATKFFRCTKCKYTWREYD
jgi:DNA-directed RNA polymerase subunit M